MAELTASRVESHRAPESFRKTGSAVAEHQAKVAKLIEPAPLQCVATVGKSGASDTPLVQFQGRRTRSSMAVTQALGDAINMKNKKGEPDGGKWHIVKKNNVRKCRNA